MVAFVRTYSVQLKMARDFVCRNFPTAENIARKKQLAQDKSQRGESAVTPLHR